MHGKKNVVQTAPPMNRSRKRVTYCCTIIVHIPGLHIINDIQPASPSRRIQRAKSPNLGSLKTIFFYLQRGCGKHFCGALQQAKWQHRLSLAKRDTNNMEHSVDSDGESFNEKRNSKSNKSSRCLRAYGQRLWGSKI